MLTFAGGINAVDRVVNPVKMDCEGGKYDIMASASGSTMFPIAHFAFEYHPAPWADVTLLFDGLAGVSLVEQSLENVMPKQMGVVSHIRVSR